MSKERSGWVYVGIGCAALALLLVIGIAAAGFFAFRAGKRVVEQVTDPATREATVKKILGADALPFGYHAAFGMAAPLDLLEVAILSDAPPQDEPGVDFGERGLFYVEFPRGGDASADRELRDYFEGRSSDASVLRRHKINIDTRQILGRGVIPGEDRTLLYVVQRGSVSTHGYTGDGIASVILVDCPSDRRTRIALWFGPEPPPREPGQEQEQEQEAGPTEIDLTGTPGDEVEIAAFMGHFRLCD